MFVINRFLKVIMLSVVLGIIMLVSGCASSSSKLAAFNKIRGDSGLVYAQVNSVTPGIDSAKLCAAYFKSDARNEAQDYLCPRLNEIKIAHVSHVKNKEIIVSNEAIPITVEVERGSIVKLDAAKASLLRFVEVASIQPTESCKWVGSDNALAYDPATKAASVVGGFVGGALLLPAAVFFASDQQGGVECNGWSYKNAYAEFLNP